MPIAYLTLPAATFYDQVDKINEIIDFLNAPDSPITTFANLTVNPGPLLVGTAIDNGQANTQLRQNARARALDVYGPAGFDDGTALAPSIAFRNSPLTGLYRSAANTIGIASNGVQTGVVNAVGFLGLNTTSPSTRLDVNDNVTFRGLIFNQGNSAGYNDLISTNSTERWYLIATMPINNGGNYSVLNLKGSFGMWQGASSPRYKIETYMGNRDGFVTNTSVRRSENLTAGAIRPVAYRLADGTVNVYVYCPASSFHIFSCQITDSIQVTGNAAYRTFSTSTPTGTLVYDAFTTRKEDSYTSAGSLVINTDNLSANGGIRVVDTTSATTTRMWGSSAGSFFGTESDSNIPVVLRSNGFNIASFSVSQITFNYALSGQSITGSTISGSTISSTDRAYAASTAILPSVITLPTQLPNITQTDARYVRLSGSTMTGPLTLNAAPTLPLHAATKDYVDANSGGPAYIDPFLLFSKDITPPVRDPGVFSGDNITLRGDNLGVPVVGNVANWRTYTLPIGTAPGNRIPANAKYVIVRVYMSSNEHEVAILYRQNSASPTICLNRLFAEAGGDNVNSQNIVTVPINNPLFTSSRSIDLIFMCRTADLGGKYYAVSIIGYQ